MLKILALMLLIGLALHSDAVAWTHGIGTCNPGTNYLLGTGCSDILLDGTDKLIAA
jgi:hypothetical protein